MQNVTEEFKQAIKEPAREIKSKITFPDLALDNENIIDINMDSSLVFSEDFEIGTAPMDTAKVELVVDTGEWGRNLLRGTQNFHMDIERINGWRNSGFTIIKEDGDYIATVERTGRTSNGWVGIYSSIIPFSKSETVTVSFLMRVDDLEQWDTQAPFIFELYDSDKKRIAYRDVYLSFPWVKTTELKSNVWCKVVATLKLDGTTTPWTYPYGDTLDDVVYFGIRLVLARNGAISFKLAKIEKGNIATDHNYALEDILDYNYEDKEADIKLGLKLPNESVEYVDMGLYTIEKAVKKDRKITLDCVDRMYKAEKEFENNLMFPTTIYEILQSACEQSGITLATTNFANSDYVVPNEPVFENITCRHIFAQVAELAGGYAKINRKGELEILTLGAESMRDITKDHYFDFKINEVAIGKIDKVIVKVGEETAETGEGENIYTIVDNMFVQNPNDVVESVYEVLRHVNYTACDFNWQGDFSLDLGDKITIDGYETYILDRKLRYTGGLREDYRAPAKSNVEKNSTGKGNLLLDMNNMKTQIKVIEGEITQTIEKVENLVVDAANRLYQSQTQIPFNLNNGNGEIQLFREAFHPYYKVTSNTNIDLSASFPQSQYAENLEGEEVTISLDVLVDVDRIVSIDGKEFEVRGNRWTRIHVTKVFPVNTTKNVRVRNPYSRKLTRDKVIGTKLIDSLFIDINTIYYRNLQVQKGNVATRWTLTPEELEDNINRISTEFKQLEDSLTLLAKKNEDSGKFEVNSNYIIGEINKTDGVGRVKTVGVTIDENGLTVDNGAIIIRDDNNTAIITSDGLKVMFVYTSSGEINGWQKVGIWDEYVELRKPTAIIDFMVPDKLNITKAELITQSLAVYTRKSPNIPTGYYHARNLELYMLDSTGNDMYIDNPGIVEDGDWPGEMKIESSATNITTDVWGEKWSPSGKGKKKKIGNIENYIIPGTHQTIAVKTSDSISESNSRYMSGLQFVLIVEGYLRG